MRLILFFFLFSFALSAQNNIVKTVGISYTNGTPTYTPAKAGSALALDTVAWRYYTWNGSSWLSDGFRVQTISGCSAPGYTPTKFQSHLVINACTAGQGGPELYYWTGSVWLQINEGQTYTEGTGIDITGTVITNTLPDQTVTMADGTGIDVTGTYPNFTVTNTAPNVVQTLSFSNPNISISGGNSLDISTVNFWTKTGSNLTYTAGTVSSKGAGSDSERFGQNTLAGTQATALGPFAVATGFGGIAVGYDAQATASTNVAIGYSSRANSGTSSLAIGYAANASGLSSIATGNSAVAAAANSTAFGKDAVVPATETGGVAFGQGATIVAGTIGGGENLAFGTTATAQEWRATAIGAKARATHISSTAIGRGAIAAGTHAIAIGRGAWANAQNIVAIGFSGGDVKTDVYFESGHTHKYLDPIDNVTITRTPSLIPIVLHGFDAYDATGTPTNNVAGGDLLLAAGVGTGTAASGNVDIQTATASGVSSNTKNTLVTRLRVNTTGQVSIGTTSPDASAKVEVVSTTQGFLPPRMTSTQRDAIASPVAGLSLYCSDCTATDGSTGVMQVYNGSVWKNAW